MTISFGAVGVERTAGMRLTRPARLCRALARSRELYTPGTSFEGVPGDGPAV